MTVRHTSYFELVEKAGRGIMLWRRRRCFFLGLTESAVLFFLRRLDVVLEVAEVLSRVLPAALVRTGFNLLDGICVPNARFVPLILRRFLTLFFSSCLASSSLSAAIVTTISLFSVCRVSTICSSSAMRCAAALRLSFSSHMPLSSDFLYDVRYPVQYDTVYCTVRTYV